MPVTVYYREIAAVKLNAGPRHFMILSLVSYALPGTCSPRLGARTVGFPLDSVVSTTVEQNTHKGNYIHNRGRTGRCPRSRHHHPQRSTV